MRIPLQPGIADRRGSSCTATSTCLRCTPCKRGNPRPTGKRFHTCRRRRSAGSRTPAEARKAWHTRPRLRCCCRCLHCFHRCRLRRRCRRPGIRRCFRRYFHHRCCRCCFHCCRYRSYRRSHCCWWSRRPHPSALDRCSGPSRRADPARSRSSLHCPARRSSCTATEETPGATRSKQQAVRNRHCCRCPNRPCWSCRRLLRHTTQRASRQGRE